ncbi:MAG: hypothetical protein HYV95_08080 [Opitutae bacterium]|nr:hypothetical protein [Opitutae bacterium]
MNLWTILLPVAIAGLITALGWLAVHRLTLQREKKNKARELRVQYLAKACRTFARTVLDGEVTPMAKEVEEAVADVYLFGTQEQISLVRKFTEEFAARQTADLDELMKSLRNDLRSELELPPLLEKPTWLKFTLKKKTDHSPEPTAFGRGSS